ncbi:MAG: FeoA family protein [Planctomycetota bacterium]
MTQPQTTCLTRLPRGTRARVERADLPSEERKLLAAMGIAVESVLKVRRAGRQCVVEVDSMRVALAGPIARCLHVTPLAG